MKGTIQTLDGDAGEILGDNKVVYGFSRADLEVQSSVGPGQRVVFIGTDENRAVQIMSLDDVPASASRSRRRFQMGNVIDLTFSAIKDNAVVFFGAAILLVGLPNLALVLVPAYMMNDYGAQSLAGGLLAFWLGALIALLGGILLQGAVVKAAINGFNDKQTSFGDAFSTGLRRFFPLLGTGIVIGIAIMIGLVIFLIPAVILMVLWIVAAPSVVAEKRGVFGGLQRSRDLTRDHRWAIFFLVLVYIVATWILGFALNFMAMSLGSILGGPEAIIIVTGLISAISGTFFSVLNSAGVSALYFELRSSKEGLAPSELASVFD